MPEVARDPITGDQMLFAPTRELRPNEYAPGHRDACPFCPGNEAETTPEAAAFRLPDSRPNEPGWRVRAFPNRYPAVTSPLGLHEVIVDSPDHDHDVTSESLRMYRDRFAHHWKSEQIDTKYVSLFKNSGPQSGATIVHPHAQLIALSAMPDRAARMLRAAQGRYDESGTCVACDELHAAAADARNVFENDVYVSHVPRCSRFPVELRILPKAHEDSFERVRDEAFAPLAAAVEGSIAALRGVFPSLSYNLVLNSGRADEGRAQFSHWHMELIARTVQFAGFELGSEMYINSTDPKESAARLRQMISARA